MSIANKLIYLNGTKDKLKESINNIGGSITDETTFRAYATELDTIYDNLPKTTGEGSNLSLNTLKGRINVDDILGDTQQEGTPTPSSPQDINVVTGTQEVVVSNKNFWKARITEVANIYLRSDIYEIEPNTQYTMSTSASNIQVINYYKDNSQQDISNSGWQNLNYSFTTPLNCKYVQQTFRKKNSENFTLDELTNLQLEKGSTATTYTPHQEQTKIVNLSSKNILNITSLQQGIIGTTTLTYVDDILTLKSGAYGSSFANLETKTLKANTQYIYELFLTETSTNSAKVSLIVQKEGNTNIINSGQITFGDQTYYSFTYTPTEDTKILRLQFYNSSTTPITADISFKVQLREVSSGSGYVPYYNYELCKIGTYQDRIYKNNDKWYKKEYIGKVVLNGSETWTMDYSSGFVSNRFTCEQLPNLGVTTQTNFNYGYCNIASVVAEASYTNILNGIKIRYINSKNRVDAMFNLESVNALTTLLNNTNMVICYQKLGGVSDIEITDTTLINELNNLEKMMSYNGQTNISVSGNLPMILDITALKGE